MNEWMADKAGKISGVAKLSGYTRQDRQVMFEFGKTRLTVTVLESGMFRVRYAFNGEFAPRRSWAVTTENSRYAPVEFEVQELAQQIEIATATARLRVRRDNAGISFLSADGRVLSEEDPELGPQFTDGGRLLSRKLLPPGEYYYGFGERSGMLNKRGYRYTCWNTDPVDKDMDHGPGADALYQSIPFLLALRPGQGGYGLFFNNTFQTVFDVGWTDPAYLSLEAVGGELDYYLMYGATPAAILESYTGLTGRTPLPPRWALGYHQCRWSYYPERVVREIAEGFRSRQIPGEVIHLDIDYMDGYRVFTWNKDRFPDPTGLIADLEQQGFKTVLIVDPGVKYDPGNYAVYDEGAAKDYFIRKADGEVYHGYVWPDDSVFPDFARAEVREWWGNLHREFIESGVHGIWNDMNEPAISTTPFGEWGLHAEIPGDAPQGGPDEAATHAEVHNLYALQEDMATYQAMRQMRPDRRPFLLTRAGHSGIQRWSAVWTGDNTAAWEHLEMAMPQLTNMGLSGVAFAGTDIGGFFGPSNPELWARWIELGAFYPFSRGHSCMGTPPKEPWAWGEQVERIARNYLEWRYRLLPYLYTLFEETSRNGAPVFRPLVYDFPADRAVFERHDQVMLGQGLMLAPVYRPGVEYRHVYFPEGQWYDFWNGQAVPETNLMVHAPLEVLPLFARGGTVVPLGPVLQYSDERPLDHLTLHIYLDRQGAAQGRLYEDDGLSFEYEQGASSTTTFQAATGPDGVVKFEARREGRYRPAARSVELKIYSPEGLKTARLDQDQENWALSV